MTVQLELIAPDTVPIEIESVTPDAVRGLSCGEIERMPIFVGNRQEPLGERFRVDGDPADGRMTLRGELGGVHWIGAKMSDGELRVEGHAGRHVGSEMTGGAIVVDGDAGDWVGGEMRGGSIHVRGNAGHLVGAAYRGSAVGMRGGTIMVNGDAGNEVGHSMRRGLIAIGGAIGDLAGFAMRAGTLLAFGAAGIRAGAGMRRGTIGLLAEQPPALLPTFRFGCRYRPQFMALLLTHLEQVGFPVPPTARDCPLDLYHGDPVELGRGEILLRAV